MSLWWYCEFANRSSRAHTAFGAIAVGIAPALLLGFSVIRSETEQVLGMSSFAFGMILIASGVLAYLINHALKPQGWAPVSEIKPQPAA